MSLINITNVLVMDNPASFTNPVQFEITFECLKELPDDLEWRLIYVGSAESKCFDQELDSIVTGPTVKGLHKFVFEADAPDPSKIPDISLLGAALFLISCSYRDKEFIRVGYFVNNEYDSPEMNEEPPAKVDLSRLVRNVCSDQPRITKFPIEWE